MNYTIFYKYYINELIYTKVIEISTRILISGDLAFFVAIVGKVKMSGC